jgi:hypothetical protein
MGYRNGFSIIDIITLRNDLGIASQKSGPLPGWEADRQCLMEARYATYNYITTTQRYGCMAHCELAIGVTIGCITDKNTRIFILQSGFSE